MKPQRFLAAAGYGSRRTCEKLILAGRASVNGNLMTFNMDIRLEDHVQVDGITVTANSETVYIALNKPVGYISDRGISYEKSALDLVKTPQRLFAMGRLDKDATGLLLLTNDGELAFKLTHPSFEHEKEYHVLVQGHPAESTLQQWRTGLVLNGEVTAPARVSIESTESQDATWLCVVLHEGRKRQIKRVAKLLGHPVIRLERVRIGSIVLGNLKPGEWRRLTNAESQALNASSNQPAQPHRQSDYTVY